MIEEVTQNKSYPLPHPENRASRDVERIATAVEMIDEDISECLDSINSISSIAQSLDNKTLKIPSELVGEVDPELKDIQAGQYVIVNEDATGFTTVEGGGGEGGKKGEILVKKSDANFDTTWLDPRAILKKAPTVKETIDDLQLPNNGTIILGDVQSTDSIDNVPRQSLTQRQIDSGVLADPDYTYILCDEIDDTAEDESNIATNNTFGRVRIGSGISVNNGEISVPIIGIASANEFGMVQIGDGLDVQDGVVSTQEYQHADRDNFGIIKPGEDFYFDSNGSLNLIKRSEDIIYQSSIINIVENGVIRVVSTCARYRAYINTDTLFSFDFGNFAPKADIGFDLEIIASKVCVVNFGLDVIWDLPCTGVNAGSTIIHFEKMKGETQLRGTLKSTNTKSVKLLTPNYQTDICKDYICGHNGFSWNAWKAIESHDYSNWASFTDPKEGIWYIDFMRSTYVEYLDYIQGFDNWISTYFYIEGSVDRKNWRRLLTIEQVETKKYTLDEHGYFKHYRIRCKNVQIRLFQWYGWDVDDDLYELQRVMPLMQTDSANGFATTSSGLASGNLYKITNEDTADYANFETRLDGQYWVKYELPEAQSVDLIDLAAYRGRECDRMPTWFRIEGSNDDENWETILERASLTQWNNGESRQYWIYNQTPYKFYRLLSIEQPTNYFMLSRFRLYKKINGISRGGFVPILSSASEGGYEISASSQYDSSHAPMYAFDRNLSTRWASTTGAGSWIQVKFPAETLCDTAWLGSRGDGWYEQAPTAFTILGSNDGESFDALKTVTNQTWTQGEEKKFSFTNDTPYLYYRVQAQTIQNGGGSFALSILNFGTDEREYKKELTVKDYLIPAMNSNLQDGYEVSVNSIYSSDWDIWKCFDHDTGTSWSTAYDSPTSTIFITMPEAAVCNYLTVYPRSAELRQAFGTMILYGSNDGETWIELLNDSSISAWTNNVEKSWEVENTTAYSNYKLVVTPYNQENCVSVSNINLFYKYTTREY